jgi:hypothetical protein
MPRLLIFAGVVSLLKGVSACVSAAQSLPASSFNSAYSVGYFTGHATVALAFLLGGGGFIKYGWSKRQAGTR